MAGIPALLRGQRPPGGCDEAGRIPAAAGHYAPAPTLAEDRQLDAAARTAHGAIVGCRQGPVYRTAGSWVSRKRVIAVWTSLHELHER